MANLGDISKINLPNGNVVNIKDTTARTQANWNTNNGVKNLSPISGGTVASVGRVAKMPCNIPAGTYIMGWVSTATSGSSVITFYKNGTQIAQGGFTNSNTYNTTSIILTDTANEIELYTNTANTISNVMVCPKSLYDADSTYEPYALPNTKITPELIELVDSGAKNLSTFETGTNSNANKWVTGSGGTDVTCELLAGKTYIVSFTTNYSGSTARGQLSCKATDNTDINSPTVAIGASCILTFTPAKDIKSFGVYINEGGVTVTNFMLCSKAAWDVSQKFVPYRPTYEETVEQVAENENNISLITPTVKYSGDAFTVGTDYTLCDACTLTIPAPANGQSIRVANILASLVFNNSAPRGIILSTSNRATDYDNNLNLLAKIESTDYVFLSTQCMFLNYRNTTANVYVWVKSSSSANNRVISSMQLMN